MFQRQGVQPGERLPELSLVTLDGGRAALEGTYGGRPIVLVTASLTCNVARRRQAELDQLAARFGEAVAVVVIYTIDAHPAVDACPYTGEEWVPADNERDAVLIRQPRTLDERIAAARDYRDRFTADATVLVDTMDNRSWTALGSSPNVGLVIDAEGVVRSRQGWFDAAETSAALDALLAR
mgnify:CR=1 FL=1